MVRKYPATVFSSGFSLIEAAIVLGVVGLVIGGIWVAAAAVSENHKQTRALQQIAYFTAQIGKIYSGQTAAAGSSVIFWDISGVGRLRRAGWDAFLPADMTAAMSNSQPISPWGQTAGITIYPAERYIAVTYQNLSTASCVALGPRIFAMAGAQLRLNDDGYYIQTSMGDISTPDLASVNCRHASGNNNLYFEYKY